MEEAGRVVEGESLSVLLFEHLSGGSNVCQLVRASDKVNIGRLADHK